MTALYVFGSVAFEVRPLNVDGVEEFGGSSAVRKDVIGGVRPVEMSGEGDEKVTLSGELRPTKLGGLDRLEALQTMRRQGVVAPLQRGDGYRFPHYYFIESMHVRHSRLVAGGVGFVVQHTINLHAVPSDRAIGNGAGPGVIAEIRALFDALQG